MQKPESVESTTRSGPLEADLIELGTLDYRAAHARQLEIHNERKLEQRRDALLFVEHPHVYTLGRRREARENVLSPGDVPVIEVERGGDVTYHGPGQIVAYPILFLREGERDLHAFLRNLEGGMIRTLATFGIDACREQGRTGVWRQGRKLASIGIACRRWITFHGLALNVNTDLQYFHRINPCGFDATVMTSMSAELERHIDIAAVKKQLAVELGHSLGRSFQQKTCEPPKAAT